MQEFLKFFTYYHLFVYSVFGFLLLILGFRKRSRLIVEISQFFLIIPISGMLIYELIDFRDSEALSVRLFASLLYSFVVIFFIAIAKRRVKLKAGFLIWILILEFLFLGSISGYTYFRRNYTHDEKSDVSSISQRNFEKEEARNYLQNIELKNVIAESYKDIDEGPSIMVKGGIENKGQKTIHTLSIKVILYGKDESAVYNETLHPVFEQKPLLPRKGIKFESRLREKPAAWSEGALSFMVTSLKLAGHQLVTNFDEEM